MCLNFMRYEIRIVEHDATGVVSKDGHAEIFLSLLFADFQCCPLDIAFINTFLNIIDWIGKDRVLTVLRPCLRERFELDIRRMAPLRPEMIADYFECLQGKC